MKYIKNIEHEKIITLENEVQIMPRQIVSKTLVQNKSLSVTLFAFDKDTEISSHSSSGDAMITILYGESRITIDDVEYNLKEGETIVMPSNKPHAVYAAEPFKMLLTVVF